MEFPRRVSEGREEAVMAPVSKNRGNGAKLLFAFCVLCALAGSAVLFSRSTPVSPTAQPASLPNASASGTPSQNLTDAQVARMSPDELAHYVFEQHGCNTCHMLGANGKLLFTERGLKLATGFEGCVSLLTAMGNIAQVKETQRSADEKQKVAHFQEFGCNSCHQITPGKMSLTNYAAKLKSLHMTCTTTACANCSTDGSAR